MGVTLVSVSCVISYLMCQRRPLKTNFSKVPECKHLRDWLFHFRSGVKVGVTNYSGVGSGVGTGVGAIHYSVGNGGVYFLLSVLFC
jgi:hypothetical protein